MQLHFLKLSTQSHSLDLPGWLGKLYIENDLKSEFPKHVREMSVHVEKAGSPFAPRFQLEPDEGLFMESNLCGARCYYKEGVFHGRLLGAYDLEVEFDLNSKEIKAVVNGEFLRSGQFVVSNFIRPLLQSFILPFFGLKTLHGAVLAKGDTTFFLAGDGGAGKSTTALQLATSGYDILSDDGPFFCLSRDRAWALSSLDYLHASHHTLSLFPGLAKYVVGDIDSRLKYPVSRAAFPGTGLWRQPRLITHYLQLKRAPGNALSLKPISTHDAFREMFASTMTVFRHIKGPHTKLVDGYSEMIFDILNLALSSAKAFELNFSDEHLTKLPHFLERELLR